MSYSVTATRNPPPTASTSASTSRRRTHAQANDSHNHYPPSHGYSVQRNDRGQSVLVIDDTPPPGANGAASSSHRYRDGAVGPGAVQGHEGPFEQNGYENAPPAKKARKGQAPYDQDPYTGYDRQVRGQANGVGTSGSARKAPQGGSAAKRKLDVYVNGQRDGSGRDSYASQQGSRPAKEAKLPPCDDKEGHFIVRPDDNLGSRYKILRLLGQGTFGRVVECWDRDNRKHVAIKVIRAVQKYRDASKVEIKVLNLLRERDPENRNKCIHLIHYFDYRNHICIVSELLSCSVFDFLKDNSYTPFPASHIQSFAKQLMKSVAFLHDLRLTHTDLKPENILLVSNEHRTVPSRKNPNKTEKILVDSSIHLIDFGSATFEDEYHANVVSTRHYRAPEIILGLGWSYPCDVWSIGCILVEFLTGQALFQTHENLEHLAMMEAVFGKMPDRYARSAARAKPEWFKSNKLDFPQQNTPRSSRKFVKAMKTLRETVPPTTIVNSRFLDLLENLLRWDPAQRITVREALRHPYFSLNITDEGTDVAAQAGRRVA